jgi:hypothetical protein
MTHVSKATSCHIEANVFFRSDRELSDDDLVALRSSELGCLRVQAETEWSNEIKDEQAGRSNRLFS